MNTCKNVSVLEQDVFLFFERILGSLFQRAPKFKDGTVTIQNLCIETLQNDVVEFDLVRDKANANKIIQKELFLPVSVEDIIKAHLLLPNMPSP